MSKPSHIVVLTKLILYLNVLLWQLGSQLKFQAIAVPLLPYDEVDTLRAVRNKLGLKSGPYIYNTYCQDSVSSYGITIICDCDTYHDTRGNRICHITEFSMNNVDLTTVIPDEMGGLGYLSSLDLSNNKLHGPIPTALGNLIRLETLDLSHNQLSGSIPASLGRLRKLQWLYLQYNLLDSTIPGTLGSLWNLQELYLHFNRLSGSIPDELGNLVNLQKLSLSENRLTGRLPDTLGKLSLLSSFWATSNSLSDTFPKSYGQLTHLTSFSIAGNYISGSLPVDIIKSWNKIVFLSLMGNNFKGNLTKEIFNLPNLQYLLISDLGNATFELPSKITNTKFLSLILRNCSIKGSIPKYIGDQMSSLKYLDLSFNHLTGELPEYMKPDLLYMSLATNMLTGTIPDWILEADQTRIDLSFNNLTALDSGVPSNQDLNLFACCRNSSATEPEMMDPLDMMSTYCREEQKYTDYTSLRKRAFDVYIQDHKVLHNFNIIKQARGPNIPITKNFTAVVNKNNSLLMIHMYWDGKGSFEFEPAFDGPLISAISVTPDFTIHDEKLRPIHIALIVIASTIIAMLLLLAFAWSMGWLGSRNSRKIKVGEEKIGEGTQDKHVTLKELIDATGKFSNKKIIGIGSLGTVYEAQLPGQSKSTVAVKRLSSYFKENIQKLKQEIKLLYALDHKNLIKLFDYHIEKDLQLLVYEYMENKSLEDALSDNSNIRLKFNWDTRFKICLGIASGLKYLHDHRRIKIAHMNIKAVNILLDENLEPKISDFGLAHLYAEEDQFKVIKREVSQGYMAPEYFQGILTSKVDVYSFGVILLEIVSWKKNVIKSNHGIEVLVDTANQKHKEENLEDMVDKTLDTYDAKQALTILNLAVKCTSIAPSVRPSMSDVVSELLGEKMIEDISKSSPNDGDKIKGSGDLTHADSTSTASMDLTSIPSTSSPSTKTKDESESM
ncbi:hypothetical protein M0R45_026055 [Rubus argutus]|uniref:non-specific serine/threonine protein kinase n=1 Tax=Rubus argutus TaxID=59490 RepID=A0AAW1WY68_RUBAR